MKNLHSKLWTKKSPFRAEDEECPFRAVDEECPFRAVDEESPFRAVDEECPFRAVDEECPFKAVDEEAIRLLYRYICTQLVKYVTTYIYILQQCKSTA